MEIAREDRRERIVTQQASISMTDNSRISEARGAAVRAAQNAGLDEQQCGRVGIVATELASNLTKHALKGEFLIGVTEWNGLPTVEMFALDQGPGITNLTECLRDGFSTAGSPGTGLGAVARLSSTFDMYTQPGKGTALLASVQGTNGNGKATRPPSMEVGAVWLAKPGEEISGDGYAVHHQRDRSLYVVVDGLGHGPDAAAVARESLDVFRERVTLNPAAIVELMHRALRSTRGGAVAVAEIDLCQKVVRFAGVGNISGVIVGPDGPRHLVSGNGIIGHDVRHIREFSYPWVKNGILVMHSDGLGTKWDLHSYGGLLARSPGIIAGVLYRDFARHRDDLAVLVARAME